jgi:hypothetical protein
MIVTQTCDALMRRFDCEPAGLKGLAIYLLSALAAAQAFDTPARQALCPRSCRRRLSNAVSLGIMVFNVATNLWTGIAGSYSRNGRPHLRLNALSFTPYWRLIACDKRQTDLHVDGRSVELGALKEGLRFVWNTPIIVQTMTLDFAATFFRVGYLCCRSSRRNVCTSTRVATVFWRRRRRSDRYTALVMARIGSFRNRAGRVGRCDLRFGHGGVWVSTVFWFR